MKTRFTLLALLSLAVVSASCITDGGGTESEGHADNTATVGQPVFIQPVFVLDGLDQLPPGLQLNELHLGVGAIFLELISSDDGVATANRQPFPLHFEINNGQLVAEAPSMTLPVGGHYAVSVQLEPQLLNLDDALPSVSSLDGSDDEVSLRVTGQVVSGEYTREDDAASEPAPLPWYPTDPTAFGSLRGELQLINFNYSSARTVRFSVGDVELEDGSSNELVMRLQVGTWVRETIRPVLDRALERNRLSGLDAELEDGHLDLDEVVEEMGDGIDGLIGDIDVETN